jgi:hypothetical protein
MAYSHTKMLCFHQAAGASGAVSRTRMSSLSACLGRQLPSSQLHDEYLTIDSANFLKGAYYHIGFPVVNRYVSGMYGSGFVIWNRILLSLGKFLIFFLSQNQLS